MDQIDRLYQDLDEVLKHLATNCEDGLYRDQYMIFEEMNSKFSELHIYQLCEKLHKDDFVSISYPFPSPTPAKPEKVFDRTKPMFLINYHGKEFYLKGGYKNKQKQDKREKYWLIAKTIAATLNAVIIIAISAYGLFN